MRFASAARPAGQPFGFTGREHEGEVGLVYARDRYLAPVVGAWIQPDRMKFVDGPNVYAYASLNPLLFTDPTGRFTSFTLGILRTLAYTEGAALMALGARDVARGIAPALRDNQLDEVAELQIDYGAHLIAIGTLQPGGPPAGNFHIDIID